MAQLKVTFAVLNLCNAHNSGNIACFNYSMFTRKLESALGLWFNCQRWRTSQGHRQSHTLDGDVTTATNRNWYVYVAYLIVAIVMILSVLEGYSPFAILFMCDISHLWCVAQSSASAELLVLSVHCTALDASKTGIQSLLANDQWFSSAAASGTWLAQSSPCCSHCHTVCGENMVWEAALDSHAPLCSDHTGCYFTFIFHTISLQHH